MRFLLLILVMLMVPQPDEEALVEVFQIDKGRFVEVHAKNPQIYPVTVHISAELDNLKPDRSIPIELVLPPKSQILVTRFYPADPSKEWEYSTSFSSYMGDINARPDENHAYRFPFRLGEAFKITQGYNGEFSHDEEQNVYALDFDLPEGTPVYSARAGRVVFVIDHFNEGGSSRDFIDKANFISVLHSDGTFGEYTHLQVNSARVQVGQEIRSGQILGLSGATGFATGPHLHFAVKKVIRGGKFISIPVKFYTPNGIVEPEEGQSYRAF